MANEKYKSVPNVPKIEFILSLTKTYMTNRDKLFIIGLIYLTLSLLDEVTLGGGVFGLLLIGASFILQAFN